MIEEFAKYTNRLTLKTYMRLAKDLMADVDRAFCRGDEVFSRLCTLTLERMLTVLIRLLPFGG